MAQAHFRAFAALTGGAYFDPDDPVCVAEGKRAGEAWSQKKRQLEEARSRRVTLPEGVHARLAEALGVSVSSATAAHGRLFAALTGERLPASSAPPPERDLHETRRPGRLAAIDRSTLSQAARDLIESAARRVGEV